MKKYKMTDTWECEPEYTTTEKDLFILAYELYCGEPIGEELEEAKKEFGTDIAKVIAYVEKECGWRAEAVV